MGITQESSGWRTAEVQQIGRELFIMKTGEVDSARLVAEYAHRHRIKPGVTGWAAIHGSRGPVDTPEAVRRVSSFDSTSVAATFAERCAKISSLPEAQQWLIGVHGKRAFNDLLVGALRSTPRAARLDLADEIDRPPPLDDLVAILLP